MSGRYIAAQARRQAIVTIVAIVMLQVRAVPADAGLAGAGDPRTRTSRRSQIAAERERWGLDKPLVPGPARRLRRVDAAGRPRLLDQVPRQARRSRSSPTPPGPTVLLIGLGEAHRDHRRARGSGATSGWRRGGAVDRIGNGLGLIFYSMPYFVIGMPLIIMFAAGLALVPDLGHDDARAATTDADRGSLLDVAPPPRPAADRHRARADRRRTRS